MKADIPELFFKTRKEFREWLRENADTSDGVWLVFGKTNKVITLTANDALEEALCYGWIDGQMKSIDSTRYIKYFARRRQKSVWSDKNKKLVEILRAKNIMTEPGEKAVEAAIKNGTWETERRAPITQEQVDTFARKLAGISPAYENFLHMPPSVRRTYTERYLSFKNEETRRKDFERIVDRLNKNLKPM